MNNRMWILGASDPEMAAIEALLRECGETMEYATEGGARVHAGNAYRAALPSKAVDVLSDGGTVYAIECVDVLPEGAVRIGHHRPGDPGYGRPPARFLEASSIGQVVRELARIGAIPSSWRRMRAGYAAPLTPQYAGDGTPVDYVGVPWLRPAAGCGYAWDIVLDANTFARVPRELVLAAAADHCLGAAYRGECPGVDPDELMRWRAESRARFQGRPVEEVLADVERAQAALLAAPELALLEDPCSAVVVRDMRQPVDQRPTRELPEAATRLGIGYVSGPLVGPDGRHKITCSGTAEQVRAFLEHWAPSQGLVDLYGDPTRGFAGGYLD